MSEKETPRRFTSILGPQMEKFIQAKRACGYRYERGSHLIAAMDRFLVMEGLAVEELGRATVERWTARKPHEKATSQAARIAYTREFAKFLVVHGGNAFVPPRRKMSVPKDFAPHIFTACEIRRILEAVDRLKPDRNSRLRHVVLPEVFRLLYACGIRLREALKLEVADVDLTRGILRIRKSKFRKDRFVPVAPSLLRRLRSYAARMGERREQAVFFPAPHGGVYTNMSLYRAFRNLLMDAKIPHGGRGRGPRLHDLRHTYAVHRLIGWYRQGADLQAKLPVLVDYMGHTTLRGTQHYLHLVAELYPEITTRLEAQFGDVIPEGRGA